MRVSQFAVPVLLMLVLFGCSVAVDTGTSPPTSTPEPPLGMIEVKGRLTLNAPYIIIRSDDRCYGAGDVFGVGLGTNVEIYTAFANYPHSIGTAQVIETQAVGDQQCRMSFFGYVPDPEFGTVPRYGFTFGGEPALSFYVEGMTLVDRRWLVEFGFP